MTSILYNKLSIDQSAVAAAFAVTAVKALGYDTEEAPLAFFKAKEESLSKTHDDEALEANKGETLDGEAHKGEANGEANGEAEVYLVFSDLYKKVTSLPNAFPHITFKELTGTIPILDMSRANVPKDIMTFLNKYSAELITIYIGMREIEGYGNSLPYVSFSKLFGSPDFDVRDAAPFIQAALIRSRMSDELANDIPAFTHKGALFLRYGPYVDRRVEIERGKENAAESIVVFADTTGFSNGADVAMKVVVYGRVPGCLASATFKELSADVNVGEISMAEWAGLMRGAVVKKDGH